MVQPVHTAPHGALAALLCPGDASVQQTALPADQESRQSVLEAVFSKAGGRALFGAGGHRPAACCLLLSGIENLPTDDGLVVVLGPVFGELPGIHDGFLADAVLAEGFLHHYVAAVFFILENGLQSGDVPDGLAGDVRDLLRLQLGLDGPERVPGQISFEDEADRLSLLRHNLRLSILATDVAQEVLVLNDHPAVLHGLAFAPAYILLMLSLSDWAKAP